MPTGATPPFVAGLLHDGGLLLLAWLFGALVGWQREAQGRPAGLRTHALVCGAACLLTLVSLGGDGGDKGRIAAQVVSGIGFLGAGVILRRGVSVRGLTTAATIWVVSGIGIATGAGGRYAVLAGLTTLLTLATLTGAKGLERAIRRDPRFVTLIATVPRRKGSVTRLIEVLTEAGANIANVDSEQADEGEAGIATKDRRTIHLTLDLPRGVTPADLSARLTEEVPEAEFAWED
jgi:putative Mg2+ transporter-C (MgtC) family protein